VPSPTLIEKCSLIANPVAGNPTQYLVEQAFGQKGLDWRFMSFEVERERLADAIRGLRALGFLGVKIGEPFHETTIEHLDELTEAAKRCGSVNCVTVKGERLIGDNTEGAALVDLVKQQISLNGKRAMVMGAGRVARAIALALAETGMNGVTIVSRNVTAGEKLVELLRQHTSAEATHVPLASSNIPIDSETAVLVNATALGTERPEAKLPLNLEALTSKAVVADVAYNASRTWLTQQAAERGCRVVVGLSLYVQQTALAFRSWTGIMPDVVPMREAAEEFLGI
jgi:shikimate dehydrogenase